MFYQLAKTKTTKPIVRVKIFTWNQARQTQTQWSEKPSELIRDIESLDLVIVASQENPAKNKDKRVEELENYMYAKGFLNIDSAYCGMYEMWIVCFVRRELRREVHSVQRKNIAMGKYGFGNKGCVAY